MADEAGKASSLWTDLKQGRANYESRAREASSLTLPYLYPPEGSTDTTDLPTPFQSVGARGVNNLASKLLLSLFPPSAPFFRLAVDQATIRELVAEEGIEEGELSKVEKQLDEAMARRELEIQDSFEAMGPRPRLFEALRHLIVAGNVLLWVDPKGKGMRVYPLNQFVVKRDPMGKVMKVVACEELSAHAAPMEVQKAMANDMATREKKKVKLYTAACRRNTDQFLVWQEVEGMVVPGSVRRMSEDEVPFLVLRLNHFSGESYGRGLVEEVLGDLISLEALSRALVEGSVSAAHVVWMINPNGFTRQSQYTRAKSGDVIPGVATDVTAVKLDKGADFSVAFSAIGQIRQRLEFAFLLNTSVQRQAERVTAEEIRFLAQELEDTLGGVYSLLTEELQLPLVTRVIARMEAEGKLEKLPAGFVHPRVVTGIEGLGRGQDLNRLMTFSRVGQETIGAQAFLQWTNPDTWLGALAAAAGINAKGLVKSADEVRAEQEQQQNMAALANIGPQATKGIADLAKQQIAQEQ